MYTKKLILQGVMLLLSVLTATCTKNGVTTPRMQGYHVVDLHVSQYANSAESTMVTTIWEGISDPTPMHIQLTQTGISGRLVTENEDNSSAISIVDFLFTTCPLSFYYSQNILVSSDQIQNNITIVLSIDGDTLSGVISVPNKVSIISPIGNSSINDSSDMHIIWTGKADQYQCEYSYLDSITNRLEKVIKITSDTSLIVPREHLYARNSMWIVITPWNGAVESAHAKPNLLSSANQGYLRCNNISTSGRWEVQ